MFKRERIEPTFGDKRSAGRDAQGPIEATGQVGKASAGQSRHADNGGGFGQADLCDQQA
ncbi:hypothetical protein [Caulobacter hibisci]|uniref:Uncharacterized protein n=1 Tax=Caulobacter hibisci TaxID=2035993 RepID=A0ABS0T070_9CAUL|nr:hypothetical protein [Caulobacter hibisci]MBI1685194.1 hypothetical protein [Caulobacter hibisci]